jgi:uncharacterized protein
VVLRVGGFALPLHQAGAVALNGPADLAPTAGRLGATAPTINNACAEQVRLAVQDATKRLLSPAMETEMRLESKKRADADAIKVFADNLRELLFAAPLGQKAVMAIDPGFRTGCKVVLLDRQGKLLHNDVVYPDRHAAEAKEKLEGFVKFFKVEAVAIGNGTGGRETEAFVRALGLPPAIPVVMVNESGASIYSASDVAREEFPDHDLTVRGAVSIGRRLMDPLAELVKLDAKSIGVGQYQHDVHQPLLAEKLDEVVVSCVNHVGVELNTASAPLLSRVAGVGPTLARKIVTFRNEHGAFRDRKQVLKVPGLGPKTFEQAAGFLRIRGGSHPLDASAVHPERYALVSQMAADLGVPLEELVGHAEWADKIDIRKYASETVGEPTLRDIVAELKKPGRDPRATFEKPNFLDDVTEIEHVKPGMILEGVVTNVTAFGAFVDIGVHQDGLIHVSELSDRFIRDPAEVVKAGDRIKVRVLNVDLARKRMALSAKLQAPAATTPTAPQSTAGAPPARRDTNRPPAPRATFNANPFANL